MDQLILFGRIGAVSLRCGSLHDGKANFYPSAFRAEGVLSSPTSVRLSVRLSVCLSVYNTFVRTITFDRIELGSPNLAQICTLAMPWTGLFMGMIDLDLQGHLGLKLINAPQNELVRTITRAIFDLE